MSRPPRPPSAPGDQRRTRRTKVFLPIEVDGGGDDNRRAHVLDISPQGARLHARTGSLTGQPVALLVAGVREVASVVWARHPNFGVRFAEPLSPEVLDRIVTAPDRAGGG